jgi:peptidoglycan/LPS O-acetylase OafA/YrhL
MEDQTVVAIVVVSLFGTIFFTLYYYFLARNKERMALIEAGLDLSQFYKKQVRISQWLRLGIFAVGIGIGLLIVGLISQYQTGNIVDVLKVSIIVLCGGVAMIVANYVDKPKQDRD